MSQEEKDRIINELKIAHPKINKLYSSKMSVIPGIYKRQWGIGIKGDHGKLNC